MPGTIPALLRRNAQMRPNAPAYYEKVNGAWVPTTWSSYWQQTRQAAAALVTLGFQPGQTVGILGFNRPEWVIALLAAQAAGGAPVGIYTTNSPAEVQYIAHHAASPVVVVENEHQLEKVLAVWNELPHLEYVVLMRGTDAPDDGRVLTWEGFLAKGSSAEEEEVERRVDALEPEDLGTLIYTSGTTGPPKGVMLSHSNLVRTSEIVSGMFGTGPGDTSLSYLPLSHIAEQMFSVHGAITSQYTIYFAESPRKVADNLREVQPTIVFGVPRVWERMYQGVRERLGEATGARKKLAEWAMGVGARVTALRNRGQKPSGLLAVQYRLAERLIFSKVKAALGLSRARICASGAAPISKDILDFMGSLDIIIYEVYGQSEGCGPTTWNRPGQTKFGSVGKPLPDVEVRIADDGEILVKGPNVFMGYYKDPEATARTLTDGWLHSGDLGRFDEEGYLFITGRKKDIIITSGGKNIAPANIETALKQLPLIADAVVIGEGQRYLTALISLDMETARKFAEEQGITEREDLHLHPLILKAIEEGINQVNQQFARVEHIRNFRVVPTPFSIEGGELTPTLKVKRNVVMERYAELIREMYAEDSA